MYRQNKIIKIYRILARNLPSDICALMCEFIEIEHRDHVRLESRHYYSLYRNVTSIRDLCERIVKDHTINWYNYEKFLHIQNINAADYGILIDYEDYVPASRRKILHLFDEFDLYDKFIQYLNDYFHVSTNYYILKDY